MDKVVKRFNKGNLGVRITEHTSGNRLINTVNVEQLTKHAFKVTIDFKQDPMPDMSAQIYFNDKWAGIDYQTDVDAPDFSWMSVLFNWLGKKDSDLEFSWSTWEIGDSTDRVHFSSLYVSEILVVQVPKREGWDNRVSVTV